MKKLNLIFCLSIVLLSSQVKSQIFVNRVYQEVSGNPVFNPVLNPFGINWSKSITNANNELITIGHTTVSGQGENLFLEKRNSTGGVIFSVNKNTTGSNNDYGVSLIEASLGGDIYVCGATDNGSSSDYDIIIYRYNASGVLQDSAQFDGGSNLNDLPSCLTIDGSGNVLIGGSTEVSTASYDYLLLKYSSSLSFINSNNYDYTGLNDIAIGIEINSGNGDISLIGASASSSATAEYAVAVFVGSSLSYLSDERSSIPGTALDQPLAYCKDASNNIYITGKAWNGSNFDVKTIKISSTYSLSWSAPIDLHGFDDGGTAISIDPVNGNIIVGGYATKSNSIKELICLRLNANTGTVITNHYQSSENTSGDAFVKALTTNTLGDVYFVGEEKGNSGKRQTLIGKIKSNGQQSWQRKVLSNNYDMKASDIELSSDGVSIISILDSTVTKYVMIKFSEFELDTNVVYFNGKAGYKQNELIVSFMPNVINKPIIDNQIGTASIVFGKLSDFLNNNADSTIANKLNGYCTNCDIKVMKIYHGLKTTDTIAISRLDQFVPIPTFWSTLLLQFPPTIDIQLAYNIFKTIPKIVCFSHPNYFTYPLTAPPNDSLYFAQSALHTNTTFPNAHVNAEEAWDVVNSGGQPYVWGGVFDTGVHWKHEDFGYDGTNSATSKIEGYSFNYGVSGGTSIKNVQLADSMGHGTSCAGIIGAVRNNSLGIAGIAGGDGGTNNSGVSLFSFNILHATISNLLSAIFEASRGGYYTTYGYGINFSNNSWHVNLGAWSNNNLQSLRDNLHFTNRMNVTFVVSRGNTGSNSLELPANYDSTWVISVGGSNSNGQYKDINEESWWLSSYGSGIDIIAPSVYNIVYSTGNYTKYVNFNGTSAAAPFVSGAVGLAMSYMNNPSSRNHYSNLAPEDCEFILNKSATDLLTAGYDSLTGWGRLNIGKAMRLIEKPFRTLYHFGTNSRFPYTLNKQVYRSVDTVKLTEKYETPITKVVYNPGKYVVKTFKIDAIISHSGLYSTDSLMFYWPRHSSSFVYDLPDAQNRLNMHERVSITNLSSGSATLTGYIFQVKDSSGTQSLGWWPCDTTFSNLYGTNRPGTLMEYSVLTKNKAVGVLEQSKELKAVNLYPNPTNSNQTIAIDSDKESICVIELCDLMGRYIKTIYTGKTSVGTTLISHNIENLSNSLYIYLVKLDGKIITKKFIKQ